MDVEGGQHDMLRHFDLLPCIEILQKKFQRTIAHGGLTSDQLPYWFTLDGLLYYMDVDADGEAKIKIPSFDMVKGPLQSKIISAELLSRYQFTPASTPEEILPRVQQAAEARSTSENTPTLTRLEMHAYSQPVQQTAEFRGSSDYASTPTVPEISVYSQPVQQAVEFRGSSENAPTPTRSEKPIYSQPVQQTSAYRVASEFAPTFMRTDLPVYSQPTQQLMISTVAPSFVPYHSYQLPRLVLNRSTPYHGLHSRYTPFQPVGTGAVPAPTIGRLPNLVQPNNATSQHSDRNSNLVSTQTLCSPGPKSLSLSSVFEEIQNADTALDDSCQKYLEEADFSEEIANACSSEASKVYTPVCMPEINGQAPSEASPAMKVVAENSTCEASRIKKEPDSSKFLDQAPGLTLNAEKGTDSPSESPLEPADILPEQPLRSPLAITHIACQTPIQDNQADVRLPSHSPLLAPEPIEKKPTSILSPVASDNTNSSTPATDSIAKDRHDNRSTDIITSWKQKLLLKNSQLSNQAALNTGPSSRNEIFTIKKCTDVSSSTRPKPADALSEEALESPILDGRAEIRPSSHSPQSAPESVADVPATAPSPIANNNKNSSTPSTDSIANDGHDNGFVDSVERWKQNFLLKSFQLSSRATQNTGSGQVEVGSTKKENAVSSNIRSKPADVLLEKPLEAPQGVPPIVCQSPIQDERVDVRPHMHSLQLAPESSKKTSASTPAASGNKRSNLDSATKGSHDSRVHSKLLLPKNHPKFVKHTFNPPKTGSVGKIVTTEKQNRVVSKIPNMFKKQDKVMLRKEKPPPRPQTMANVTASNGSVKKKVTFGDTTYHFFSNPPETFEAETPQASIRPPEMVTSRSNPTQNTAPETSRASVRPPEMGTSRKDPTQNNAPQMTFSFSPKPKFNPPQKTPAQKAFPTSQYRADDSRHVSTPRRDTFNPNRTKPYSPYNRVVNESRPYPDPSSSARSSSASLSRSRLQSDSNGNSNKHVSASYSGYDRSIPPKRSVADLSRDGHNTDRSNSKPPKKPMPETRPDFTSSFNTLTMTPHPTAPEIDDIFSFDKANVSSSPYSEVNEPPITPPKPSKDGFFTFNENIESD